MSKNKKIIITVYLLVLLFLAIVFVYYHSMQSLRFVAPVTVLSVDEPFINPDTANVSVRDARLVEEGAYHAPINPDAVHVALHSLVPALTLKQAYDKTLPDRASWSPDAALVYVRSLGLVNAEGESGEWQIVVASTLKKSAYEILVYGDKVVSKKEIPGAVAGYAPPVNWYDSGDALVSLRALPQFSAATVSSISFYYNEDGKKWGYALATSNGTVAMAVK